MHKDPPPGILERPAKVIIIYGVLTGFIAGVVVFGTWSLFASGYTRTETSPPPAISDRPR